MFGVQGTITDSVTGEAVTAAVFIEGHDMERSWVTSDSESGNYFRPLFQGEYTIRYTADGYQTKTINQVLVNNKELTSMDVELFYTGSGFHNINSSNLFQIGPNPNNGKFYLAYIGQKNIDCEIQIWNVSGEMIKNFQHDFSMGSGSLSIDLINQSSGIYFVVLIVDEFTFNEKIILK